MPDKSPLDGLDETFAAKLAEVVVACESSSAVIVKPYFGVRDPITQAKLWRQSRPRVVIETKIKEFRDEKADFLADCLEAVGPQNGPWATNAPPGLSWHQFGEAMDCVWMRNGEEEWSTDVDGRTNGYKIYAAVAQRFGLTSLGETLGDWGHVQLRRARSPEHVYSLVQVNKIMEEKFGGLLNVS